MPIGLTRILVINSRLEQALSVKRVLEPLGKYDVRPFTALENALAFSAADAAPDLVVLDVELRGYKVGEVIALLRRRSAHLPIILTGASDEEAQQMGAQAGLKTIRGRDLLPLIQRLTARPVEEHPAQPDKMEQATQPDRSQIKTLPSPPELFPILAAEEPPPPTLAEGGTIRDLIPPSARDSSASDGVIELEAEAAVPDGTTSHLSIVSEDEPTYVPEPSVPQQILQGAQTAHQSPDTLVEQFAPRPSFDEDDADLDSKPEAVAPSSEVQVTEDPTPPPAEETPQSVEAENKPPARQLGRRKTVKLHRAVGHGSPSGIISRQIVQLHPLDLQNAILEGEIGPDKIGDVRGLHRYQPVANFAAAGVGNIGIDAGGGKVQVGPSLLRHQAGCKRTCNGNGKIGSLRGDLQRLAGDKAFFAGSKGKIDRHRLNIDFRKRLINGSLALQRTANQKRTGKIPLLIPQFQFQVADGNGRVAQSIQIHTPLDNRIIKGAVQRYFQFLKRAVQRLNHRKRTLGHKGL